MSRSRSQSDGGYNRKNSRSRSRSPRHDVRGRVIRINDRSGYGFLQVDGEDDEVFFHSNDVVDNIDIRKLREGDEVTLDLFPSKKKPGRYDAKSVRPPDSAKERTVPLISIFSTEETTYILNLIPLSTLSFFHEIRILVMDSKCCRNIRTLYIS